MRYTDLRLRGALAGGLVLGLTTLALGAGTVSAAGVSLPTGGGATTRLVPGYLRGLSLASGLGTAPGNQTLTIGVELTRPNAAGEQQLYDALYDKASAQYHHFLTPAQFNARFGVPAAQHTAVHDWLTAGGVAIISDQGDYVTARGTVSALDRLLHVTIGRYAYKTERFMANNAPPAVPSSLPITGIAGLDTLHRFALNDLHGQELTKLTALAHSAPAVHAVGPQAGDQQEFTPQELWGVYDDPSASSLTQGNGTSTPATVSGSSAPLGQGQTIGIFGEGETSSVIDQLRLFETATGLPKVAVRVHHPEGGADSGYGDNTGAIEWYLDSQSSTGMAPDVSQLELYFAKTLFDADMFADFKGWANDPNGPRQMDASFGECEANPTNPVTGPLAQQPYGTELGDELQAMGDPILRQAAIEGRTLFSSAGDTGSGCPELVAPIVGGGNGVAIQPVPFVGYPCDSQYVVCVGGTVVTAKGTTYPTAAQRTAETAWTFSGGGSSHFISEPNYQEGVKNVNLPCVSTPTGTPYTGAPPTCRGVPDIADLSGNVLGDGYFIYNDGEPSSEGGTSLSSPLMLGQWARVQSGASRPVQGRGGLGFANPVIYAQAKGADGCGLTSSCAGATTYGRDFFDITDSEFGAGNGAYQPSPGWDYASGWGALNVANFIHDVDGSMTAGSRAGAAEKTATDVSTAAMTSPAGNATNPLDVGLGNDASLDLTKATLTTSADGAKIVATLSGPSIGGTRSAGDNLYYVTWEYGGKVFYAKADEASGGTFTYTSGNTGTYGTSSTYGYNDTASSAATGSVSSHTITITVPAKEVGFPPVGSALTVPQAFDQLDASPATGASTTDSSDDIGAVSRDSGLADSIGHDVIVGGAAQATATGTARGSSTAGGTGRACLSRGPYVHGSARASGRGFRIGGESSNHGCSGHVTRIDVAIAKVSGKRCRFLGRSRRFGRLTACKPRSFLTGHGTTHWSYSPRVRLTRGVYLVWFRAVNSKHQSTRGYLGHHIHLGLR